MAYKYLDNASTTKVDQRVIDEMLPYFNEYYGNASSNHSFGKSAKDAIDKSRLKIAEIINSDSDEIIFTSGATESINLALKGFMEANVDKGNHIITVKTEHKAVLTTCEYLETKGYEVTYLEVNENGLISIEQLENAKKENTILIAVMYVNNETGAIQPIKEIGKFSKENNISFFCDATQAIGKIKVDVEADFIDMLCFSAHKINGPKGIGALYKNENTEITPLIHGGGQENGLRSGTYNTPLIVGLGKACEIANSELDNNNLNMKKLIEYLIKSLKEIGPFIEVSKKEFRTPYILNIIIPKLDSAVFISKYSSLVTLSNGSACNSEIIEGSHVLKAMVTDVESENSNIRISLDKFTTKENIDYFIKILVNHLNLKYA